jgi:hypothetical protein
MKISNNLFLEKINSTTLSKEYLLKYYHQTNENINLLDSSIRKTDNLNSSLKSLKLHQKINESDFITLNLLINEIKKKYAFKYRNIDMDLLKLPPLK